MKDTGAISFSGRFLLSCAGLFACLELAPAAFYDGLNRINAAAAACLLQALGYQPTLHQTVLTLNGFSARIIGECSAVFIFALFAAFILAYPSRPAEKAAGILIGIPMLSALNVLRLVVVIGTGAYKTDLFPHVHIYFGQILMVFFVLLISIYWLKGIRAISSPEIHHWTFFRFALISAFLFAAWLFLKKPYALLATSMVRWTFFLLGGSSIPISAAAGSADTFITFNIVCFLALALSVNPNQVNRKTRRILTGITILFFSYYLFKGIQTMAGMTGTGWGSILSINMMLILQEWVLPFTLWFVLFRPDVLSASFRLKPAGAA